MSTRRFRRRVEQGERGAALVEFALIFPIFMMLVLGMLTGGRTYNDELSITHAARESARYAATLEKGTAANLWWSAVEDRVVEAAAGNIDLAEAGHWVCIALVKADGVTPVEQSPGGPKYSQLLGSHPNPGSVLPGCYDDGLTDSKSRVHVMVGRPGEIDALFVTHKLNLESRATARFEH